MLNTLQSNAQVIASWTNSRRQNLEVDLRPEMENYIHRLGIDLDKMSVIHVAGTKGKGSTCAFTESILRHCGYSTGFYSSPHLVSVRERIRLNGQPISQELFAHYFWQVWNRLKDTTSDKFPDMPSYFRFLTLLSFKIFIDEKVDVSVIEVGVGGRTDATNIVDHPVVCAVTPLGYDHMNVLGNTLTDIGFEKSGIFKKGVPAFIAPQPSEGLAILKKRAKELIQVFPLDILPVVKPFQLLEEKHIALGLEGEHQKMNACLAAVLAKTWMDFVKNGKSYEAIVNELVTIPSNVSQDINLEWPVIDNLPSVDNRFVEGLINCKWDGRGQRVVLAEHPNVEFFMDGAHTPESVVVCRDWFVQAAAVDHNVVRVLVFNCANSRDPKALLQPFASCTWDYAYFTTNETSHEHVLEDKRDQRYPNQVVQDWQQVLIKTWGTLAEQQSNLPQGQYSPSIPFVMDQIASLESKLGGKKIQVLITGSLYLVGACLEELVPEMSDRF